MNEKTESYWLQRLDQYHIPHHCRPGLSLYFAKRRPTGSFLRAVLCNDFVGAVTRADTDNLPALRQYAYFLANEAPDAAWGSQENVDAWIAGGADG